MNTDSDRRRPGRPLSFDRGAALERAMHVFWAQGYESTSIADLTRAMRITAPSIYTAFGDKKRLFLEAVALYSGDKAEIRAMLDAAPTAREAAARLLERTILLVTGEDTPAGCLLVSSTASVSPEAADVQAAVAAVRGETRDLLEHRIEADRTAGIVPHDVSAELLADTIFATLEGLSVLARDGMARERLRDVARQVLAGWPGRA